MTPADHKHFEGRLLEERARLLKELGHLEENVLNAEPARHVAATCPATRSTWPTPAPTRWSARRRSSSPRAEGRALHDVDEALRRLYSGEYGICESCGKPIAPQRLEVVPHARLCITCKEKEEKAGRR